MVARGFEQRQGIDYVDTSAPVAGVTGFRIIVCTALIKGWNTHSWDVDSAFLHCNLEEEIYMKPPGGYTDPLEEGKVFLLLKTIYWLKQVAHAWHGLLAGTFRELGYEPSDQSDCMWQKTRADGHVCLACHHVDD
jgi:hypothetical protein